MTFSLFRKREACTCLDRNKTFERVKLEETGSIPGVNSELQVPEWLGEEGLATLSRGYLLQGETPRGIASASIIVRLTNFEPPRSWG